MLAGIKYVRGGVCIAPAKEEKGAAEGSDPGLQFGTDVCSTKLIPVPRLVHSVVRPTSKGEYSNGISYKRKVRREGCQNTGIHWR